MMGSTTLSPADVLGVDDVLTSSAGSSPLQHLRTVARAGWERVKGAARWLLTLVRSFVPKVGAMARRVVQKAKRGVRRKAREPIATTPVPSTEQTTAQTFVATSEAIEDFEPQSEDGVVAGESDLPKAFFASNADAKGGFTSAADQDETGAYDGDGDDDEEDLEVYVGDVEENNDEDSPGVFDGVLLEGDDDDLTDMDDDDFEEIGGLDADFSDIDDDCEDPPVQAPRAAHVAQPCGFVIPGEHPAAVSWPFVVPTVATSGSTGSVVRNRIGAQQNEEEDVSEVY